MQTIPLDAAPAQEISVLLDGAFWTLRFHATDRAVLVDVTRDNVTLLSASRVLAGEYLLPFVRLEAGNFIMLTEGDALPDWQAFGTTQTLIYLTGDELAVIRDA